MESPKQKENVECMKENKQMYCFHQVRCFKIYTSMLVYPEFFIFSVCGLCTYNDFVKIEPLVMRKGTPLVILR